MDKPISEADRYGKQILFLLGHGFVYDTRRSDCDHAWLSLSLSDFRGDLLVVSLTKEARVWRMEATKTGGKGSSCLVYYGSLEYVLHCAGTVNPTFALFIPTVPAALKLPLNQYSVVISYTVSCSASSAVEAEDTTANMVRDSLRSVPTNLMCRATKQED